LGLRVYIGRLLAIVMRTGSEQRYYLAVVVGGAFGSGRGEDLRNAPDHARGTSRPVWLERLQLADATCARVPWRHC
jgi:hypothetical protein